MFCMFLYLDLRASCPLKVLYKYFSFCNGRPDKFFAKVHVEVDRFSAEMMS